MAKRISAEERERIIAAFATGSSCNEIAKQFNRSPDTIHRIARSVEHVFGYTNARNAQVARRAYGAERRANVRNSAVESVERLFGQMFAETMVYNFGGKDNDFNTATVPEPSHRDKQAIGQTIATLWRVVKDIDAAEATQNDTSGLEDIFRQLAQVADEHDNPPDVQPETGGGDQPQ